MGVDIVQLGNHNIQFKGKSFSELVHEIMPILESIKIDNLEYLQFALLDYFQGKDWLEEKCEWLKKKKDWTYGEEDEYFQFSEDKCIDFYGPGDLEITFTEHYILFFDPPYRYNTWFWLEKIHRDEWRKYMHKIITAFGGNRVIYLPDNVMDSSEYYQNNDGMTFEEIESGLMKDYGIVTKDLDDLTEDDEIDYYIDTFNSIDWEINAPLESAFG